MKIKILFVGLNGATANTFVAGILATKAKKGTLNGCVTDLKEFSQLELPKLNDFSFGGWDIIKSSVIEAATAHAILPQLIIDAIPRESNIDALPGWKSKFDPPLLKEPNNLLPEMPLTEIVSQFEQDIKKAKHDADCDSCIVVLLGPPLREFSEAMQSLLSVEDLEQAIAQDRKNIVPSPLVYALAGIRQGCAILDFTANKTLEIRALVSLAERCKVPIAGRDGSTGQTYLKHGIATLLGMRGLAIKGWYSANILGNQDGYVLNMPEFAVTKMQDKTAALNKHCGLGPDTHVVDISYYRPRGDNKESWDSIDFTGWFDLPMQLKLNWLGRDSILAGPLLLDLCRLLAYELKAGTSGIQSHLAFYFKCPLGRGIPYSPFEQINLLKKRFNL